MLFKSINSNRLGGLILVPLMAFALYAIAYFRMGPPLEQFSEDGMPLWNLLVFSLNGSPTIFLMVGFAAASLIALVINRMANQLLLFGKPTFLPATLFFILSSGFVLNQQLTPIWLFSVFFIFSLAAFFSSTMQENKAEYCFGGAILYSIGSLFYGKALLLAPVIWFLMIGLRSFSLKSFFASIIGFLLPYLYIFFVPIQLNQQRDLVDLILHNMFIPVKMIDYSIPFFIYTGILVFIILLALVSVLGKYSSKKIATRNYYKIFIISVLFLFGLSLTRYFSIEIIPLFSIGSSFMVAHLLNNLKSTKVSSFLFYLLLLSTLCAQYYF